MTRVSQRRSRQPFHCRPAGMCIKIWTCEPFASPFSRTQTYANELAPQVIELFDCFSSSPPFRNQSRTKVRNFPIAAAASQSGTPALSRCIVTCRLSGRPIAQANCAASIMPRACSSDSASLVRLALFRAPPQRETIGFASNGRALLELVYFASGVPVLAKARFPQPSSLRPGPCKGISSTLSQVSRW